MEDKELPIVIEGVEVPATFVVTCRWVTDRLAFGGMIGTSANMKRLRDMGITAVINLQAEFDDTPLGAAAGIEVLWQPVAEPLRAITPESVTEVVSFATTVLREPANKLFVHCLAGRSRAPTFTYAILRAIGYERQAVMERILGAEPRAQLEETHLHSIENFFRPLSKATDADTAGECQHPLIKQ
jgi:hypothetical protein